MAYTTTDLPCLKPHEGPAAPFLERALNPPELEIENLSISSPQTPSIYPTDSQDTSTEPSRVGTPSSGKGKKDGKEAREPKSRDPFTFGNRTLNTEDDPFTHNAWDHVQPDEEFNSFFSIQLDLQRQHPVPAHLAQKFQSEPARYWDVFYKHNTDNFFKDRAWLFLEFPVLRDYTRRDAGPRVLLEMGCGAGNTLLPILAQNENPHVRCVGLDFSPRAVEMVRGKCAAHGEGGGVGAGEAYVWDLSRGGPIEGVREGSVDVVIMIFVFSALAPADFAAALGHVRKLLRPGGSLLFRDYARGDLAQVRMKKGRLLEENFYVRGDGTRVYFFEEDEMKGLLEGAGFRVKTSGVDRRMLVNRKRRLKMYRAWLQVVAEKVGEEEEGQGTNVESEEKKGI